jgi:hypothetical protein
MLLGFAVSPQPAQAATKIYANLTMNVYGEYDEAVITVHLPMPQADAAGYLYNDARIMIGCWGDDMFADDWLLRYDNDRDPVEEWHWNFWAPYTPADNQVYAAPDGVRLRAIIRAPHNQDPAAPDAYHREGVVGFNEDAGYTLDGYDEVYCRATWIDGDGARIAAFTQVRSGWF